MTTCGTVGLLTGLIVFSASEAIASPLCPWVGRGSMGVPEIRIEGKTLVVEEFVPAHSIVNLLLTNNGKVIEDPAGVPAVVFTCDNSKGNEGFTDKLELPPWIIGGKAITDVKQETVVNPAGVLQAAAFNFGGSMPVLADWLFDAGFTDIRPLGIPDFFSPTLDKLFFGVALDAWASQGFTMATDSLGSIYEIVNGLAMAKLGGNGPTATQLSSYFFGISDLSPGIDGWTGMAYTGTAELIGWHQLSATVTSPEPTSVLLMGTGLAAVARLTCKRKRKRFDSSGGSNLNRHDKPRHDPQIKLFRS